MLRQVLSILSVAIAGAAIPGFAAAQTPPNPNEIIVQAQLDREEERVEEMTRAITRRPRVDYPVARQYAQICIGVFGMSPDFARTLIARMEENARRLDIAVAGEGCQINTLVGFVSDGPAEVERLRKEEPWLFNTLLDYEYKRIFRGNSAVQAWHATELKEIDGKPFGVVQFGDPPRNVRSSDSFSASNIDQQVRLDMIGSVVLMDSAKVPGKTLQQLADYAAMRSFASVDDVSGGGPDDIPTILSLFDEGDFAPDAMTDFDWAYLEALYKLPRNASGAAVHDATWSAYRKRTFGTDE